MVPRAGFSQGSTRFEPATLSRSLRNSPSVTGGDSPLLLVRSFALRVPIGMVSAASCGRCGQGATHLSPTHFVAPYPLSEGGNAWRCYPTATTPKLCGCQYTFVICPLLHLYSRSMDLPSGFSRTTSTYSSSGEATFRTSVQYWVLHPISFLEVKLIEVSLNESTEI